jgi:hypothetical protein
MLRFLLAAVLAAAALAALLPASGGEPVARDDARPTATTRPAGTLVIITGQRTLTAIDVASGRRTSRVVRSVAACGPELHVIAGRVVFAAVRESGTIVFSIPLALDRRPTRLGRAHQFVPSATPGRVWLAGTDCERSRMGGAREMTVDGRVTVRSERRLPGQWLAGAVGAGLVVQRMRSLLVWDPRSGRTVRRLGLAGVAATRGDLMVGCTTRSRCRDVAIADAGSARTVVARPVPRHRLDFGGKLSPDGSLLAVPAYRQRRWRVAIVDTRTGASTLIRGTGLGRSYPFMAWSASSGWLFVRGHGGRISAYRPGAQRAVRLPIQVRGRIPSFAAG